MDNKVCFFIGHREANESIMPALQRCIEKHILTFGVGIFIVGQYGKFDRMVISALRTIKQRYPWITLLLLIPYHPAERPVPVPDGFDNTYYPAGMETVPKSVAIVRANRYMVDHCNYLIAYVTHTGSNAEKLLDYAYNKEKRKLIHIENLGVCNNES